MELMVEARGKKNIERVVANKKTYIRVIKVIEIIVLIIALIAGPGFIIYHILNPDTFVGTVGYEVKKNYDLIFITGLPIGSGLFTMWILVVTLRKKLSLASIGSRTDEALIIEGDSIENSCLYYSYRIKYESSYRDRGLYTIKLNEIENVKYDNETKEIRITGKMFAKWITDVVNIEEVDISNRENNEFVIYDYFSPSLIEELKKYPIKINYEDKL